MNNIVVLASGNGTTLQAIIDAIAAGKINANISHVICDRDAPATGRAKRSGISYSVIKRGRDFQSRILKEIEGKNPDLIVLAGFLSIIGSEIVKRFPMRIINLHPALLPCFGGPGYYGERVHMAVLESGAKYSGCTVHFVTEDVDAGPIILQRIVEISDHEDAESLGEKIHAIEHSAIVDAINIVLNGNFIIKGKRVLRI